MRYWARYWEVVFSWQITFVRNAKCQNHDHLTISAVFGFTKMRTHKMAFTFTSNTNSTAHIRSLPNVYVGRWCGNYYLATERKILTEFFLSRTNHGTVRIWLRFSMGECGRSNRDTQRQIESYIYRVSCEQFAISHIALCAFCNVLCCGNAWYHQHHQQPQPRSIDGLRVCVCLCSLKYLLCFRAVWHGR